MLVCSVLAFSFIKTLLTVTKIPSWSLDTLEALAPRTINPKPDAAASYPQTSRCRQYQDRIQGFCERRTLFLDTFLGTATNKYIPIRYLGSTCHFQAHLSKTFSLCLWMLILAEATRSFRQIKASTSAYQYSIPAVLLATTRPIYRQLSQAINLLIEIQHPANNQQSAFCWVLQKTYTNCYGCTNFNTHTRQRVHPGANEDLKFLNNIDTSIAAWACYILDTVKVAQYTLQRYYRYSLEKLLDALSIPYSFRLHSAGNDAFFALKALLMMAARDMSAEPHASEPEHQQTIVEESSTATTLEAIACFPYPLPADKPQEALGPEKVPKLSIGAKRRLRAKRKAIRRENRTVASIDRPEQDTSHGPEGTTSNDNVG